ncbi:F-box/WD repeat-containing protein 9 [Anabrus simplex]|uniref:F-box/WD repeat-containing protein 9 n=1 Tax=Anabrus simplex TaxID=316456 RepID=UPI0034DD3F2D
MDDNIIDELHPDTAVEEMLEAVNSISLKEDSDNSAPPRVLERLPLEDAAESNMSLEDEDQITTSSWSLDSLPVEVFLHICSFLDARFIACSMRFVCKHFHVILSDEFVWKSRVGRRWNNAYPPLPVKSEEFSWMKACTLIEEEDKKWSTIGETMHRVTLKDVHFACVDAVLLMNSGSLLISGSRDHSLIAWNLENVHEDCDTFSPTIIKNAHDGWVWNLAAKHDVLFSCSWDATVKTWQVEEGGLHEVSAFPCRCPALSLACNENVVAAGLYSRAVNLYDPRSGTKFISSYFAHRGPVLALAMTNDFIVSASEDKSLSVWDQRAGKIFKKRITFGNSTGERRGNTPLCLSLDDSILYVGDGDGQLHLLNPAGGLFNLVMSYNTGHTGKLTAIQHNLGCVITSSTDRTLRVLTPTRQPELIGVIPSEAGEVTRFDYKNNILAAGGTDCAVELWIPKSAAAN